MEIEAVTNNYSGIYWRRPTFGILALVLSLALVALWAGSWPFLLTRAHEVGQKLGRIGHLPNGTPVSDDKALDAFVDDWMDKKVLAIAIALSLLALVPLSLGITSLIRKEKPRTISILALVFVFVGPPIGLVLSLLIAKIFLE